MLPLSKINVPQSPNDTRPIAKLCKVSKVLKKVIRKQLSEHLEYNHILIDRQSGFLEDIRFSIDKRKLTLLVFFYFSKAS